LDSTGDNQTLGIASDFVLIVVAGLLGAILARFLRLPLLVGYVAAGIVVGPHTAGPTVVQIHDVELLAEIGVALLLFSLGLEISFNNLKPVRRIALFGGSLQIAMTVLLATLAGIQFLRMPNVEAIWFGAMISVSSTMVVLKVLAAAGVTSTLASRVMIGLLVMQDLAVIPMLIVLPRLGGDPASLLSNVASSLALSGAFLAATWFLGTRLLPVLLGRILAWGSRELFLVAVVATGVGVGYATHAAGMSFALGAFVAGLILSESEFSHQALSDVAPLRDIFGLLFFVSVGMLFEPAYALANAGLIATVTALIFAGKALIFGTIARGFGYTNMAPWVVGLGLSQIGEFSFVLARTGLAAGLVSKPTYDLVLTATVLTMALSPTVSGLALPLGRAWQRAFPPSAPSTGAVADPPDLAPLSGHVIVGGYGRAGRAAAQALSAAGIGAVVVESNYASLPDIAAAGFRGLWGDISSPEILHAAGAEEAAMLLLTMPEQNTVHLAVQRTRQLNPSLAVIARASRGRHLAGLHRLGVVSAVQPEFEGGLEMVRQALLHFHQPADEVLRIVDNLRAELYEREA
jgi:monovalent cation:H+ antiporter-2, CPA2 family